MRIWPGAARHAHMRCPPTPPQAAFFARRCDGRSGRTPCASKPKKQRPHDNMAVGTSAKSAKRHTARARVTAQFGNVTLTADKFGGPGRSLVKPRKRSLRAGNQPARTRFLRSGVVPGSLGAMSRLGGSQSLSPPKDPSYRSSRILIKPSLRRLRSRAVRKLRP